MRATICGLYMYLLPKNLKAAAGGGWINQELSI